MINQKEIKKIKKTFHNKGYVVLKNFIPRKLINEIKSDVTKLLEMKMINNIQIYIEKLLNEENIVFTIFILIPSIL